MSAVSPYPMADTVAALALVAILFLLAFFIFMAVDFDKATHFARAEQPDLVPPVVCSPDDTRTPISEGIADAPTAGPPSAARMGSGTFSHVLDETGS